MEAKVEFQEAEKRKAYKLSKMKKKSVQKRKLYLNMLDEED